MQVKDRRIFSGASINLDKDQRSMQPNEHNYLLNCTDLVYTSGEVTAITNIEGNKKIQFPYDIKGINKVIGSYNSKATGTVIYFIHNTTDGHSIMEYNPKTETLEAILLFEQTLNFNSDYPINSISVIDDNLCWTDDYNEPRSILIKKAKAYTASKKYYGILFNSSTINNIVWTEISLTDASGLLVGDKIYIKENNDYYNGLATIISIINNNIIIDKAYQSSPTNCIIYKYNGNKQYYGITEDLLRFIKKPPVCPPSVEYDTKISFPENHKIIINEIEYGDYLTEYIFGFKLAGGQWTNVVFSKTPTAGQYQLSKDINYVVRTIANTLQNSLFPETTSENETITITDSNNVLSQLYVRVTATTINNSEAFKISVDCNDDNIFVYNQVQQQTLIIDPLSPTSYTKSNSLRGRYFNVMYRWKYDDKSYSVFSSGIKSLLPIGDITVDGRYTENEYLNNVLNISFNNGSDEVEQVEIAITTTENPDNPYVVKRFYKYDENGNHVLSNTSEKYKSGVNYTYEFDNTEYGINISDQEVKRLFDLVPLKASNITILDTRNAVFSKYTEGYDNVPIKAKAEVITEKDVSYPINSLSITELQNPISTNWVIAINPNNTLVKDILFSFDISITGGVNGVQKTFSNKIRYLTKENDTLSVIYNSLQNSIRSFLVGCQVNGMVTASGGMEIITTTNGIILSPYQPIYTNVFDLNLINPSSISSYTVSSYKSGATHKFAVRYFDRSGRCGADNEAVSVYVNSATENVLTSIEKDNQYVKNKIKLKLYNKPPTWADKFEITYSKSNISSFIQYYGAITQVLDLFHFTLPKEILDLQSEYPKVRENLSAYTYTKGDRLRIISFMPFSNITYNGLTYLTGQTYYLPEYFDVELFGWDETNKQVVYLDRLPTLLTTTDNYKSMLIKAEIYSIKKERADQESGEMYFSTGYCFNIENGLHTGNISNQTETQPSEILLDSGDIFVRNRLQNKAQSGTISMIIESDNGNDFYISDNIWYTKPSLVLQDAKNKTLKSNYRWGGNFIEGSDTSYLKRFLSSDYDELPESFGEIKAAIQRGNTLKHIQETKVYSTYIGVSEIADQTGGVSLIKTDRLFGGVRPSDYEYGTKYQLSVCKTANAIYFVDTENNAIVIDSGNALFDITTDRVKTFMNYINKMFNNSYSNNIQTVYDKEKEQVLFNFIWTDKLLDQLPIPEGKDQEYRHTYKTRNKTLIPIPEGKDQEYRHTYKTRNKTLIWSEKEKSFKGFIDLCINKATSDFTPYSTNDVIPTQSLCTSKDTYVSFINGELWVKDLSVRNKLFGEQKKQIISTPSNIGQEKVMVYDSIEIHTNNNKINGTSKNWKAKVETKKDGVSPTGQKTLISESLFKQKETFITADILRDINTIMSGSKMYKLYNGDVIRGEGATITIENSSNEEIILYSVIIKQSPSEMSV